MNRRIKPGFTPAAKALILARSGGICELDSCGPAEVIHHRRPRGAGGTSLAWVNQPANGLHVSRSCHDWIEGRIPSWSRVQSGKVGWLVSQHSDRVSADVPVLYRNRWVLLTDDGRTVPAQDGAA